MKLRSGHDNTEKQPNLLAEEIRRYLSKEPEFQKSLQALSESAIGLRDVSRNALIESCEQGQQLLTSLPEEIIKLRGGSEIPVPFKTIQSAISEHQKVAAQALKLAHQHTPGAEKLLLAVHETQGEILSKLISFLRSAAETCPELLDIVEGFENILQLRSKVQTLFLSPNSVA